MRIFTLLFSLVITTSMLAQSSLFQAESVTSGELSSAQANIFNMLMDQGVYTSYQFVSTNYTAFQDDNGVVSVDLSEFISQPSVSFNTSSMKWDDESDFQYVGRFHGSDTATLNYGVLYLLRDEGVLN